MTTGKCPHGEFLLEAGCPQCMAEALRKDEESDRIGTELESAESIRYSRIPAIEENAMQVVKIAQIKIAPAEDPRILALYEEGQGLLRYAEARVITTNADLKPLTDDLIIIKKVRDTIEEFRVEFVKPIRDNLELVNKAFKDFTAPLIDADVINRDKVKWFRAEQERIQQEVDRIEAEKLRLAKEEEELTGEHTVDLTPIEKPAEVPNHVRTESGTAGTLTVWKYEITDFALLPNEYKIADTALLNATIKKHHADKIIPGVRIYAEESLRVTKR